MRSGVSLFVGVWLTGLIPTAVLAATATHLTTTHTLSMDEDPQAAGWWLWEGGGSHSVSDGILRIEAPNYYEFFAPPSVWVNKVSNARGWTVETRMRRDSTSIGTPGLWINDNRYLTLVGIQEGKLQFASSSDFVGSFAIDTSVFNTYRFEGKNKSLNVFVNDALAMSLVSDEPIGATFALSFGDNNQYIPGNSVSEWDYVTVTTTAVPLPPGILLLASSVLALGALGWRRNHAAAQLVACPE